MTRTTLLAAALVVAVSAFSTPADLQAAGQKGTRTQRGQLVERIVTRWGVHVQETYRADVRKWAMDMVPTFSRVSLDSLGKASRARTFEEMNNALLGDAAAREYPNLAMAVGMGKLPLPEKALGDAATDLVYVPVTPCRILDTRVAGGVIPANSTRDFDITSIANYSIQGGDASNCNGVGAAGSFAAAVINFTVVTPNIAGYITAFPHLAAQPLAATVNYTAGDIRGNLAIVKLDQGPATAELTVYSFAQTHLVGDIVGYFIAPNDTLECVNTSVSSFTINANSVNFFNNPTCPTGFTAITPYCWTAASGVYSQGSGYNANATGNATFCAWQNTTASNQTTFGGNVCCKL